MTTTYTARIQFGHVKLYDNNGSEVIATFASVESFEEFVGMKLDAYNNQQAARAANAAPIESAAKLNRD